MTGPAVTVEMRRNEHIWEVITGISVIYERLARGDEGERGPGRAVVCVTIGTQRGGFVHRGMWVWTSGDEVPRALLWKHQVGSWRQRSCTSLQVCAFCMHCVCIVYVLCVVCVLFYVSMSDACLCIVCIFCTFYVLCMFYLCALCFMCVYVLCVLMSMYCVYVMCMYFVCHAYFVCFWTFIQICMLILRVFKQMHEDFSSFIFCGRGFTS